MRLGSTGSRLRATMTALAVGAALTVALPAAAEPGVGGVKYLAPLAGTSVIGNAPFEAIGCPTASQCQVVGGSIGAIANGGGKAAYATSSPAGTWSAAAPFA